jgi:hypothetical protein
VDPGGDEEHHEDDVERVAGCPLLGRAIAQEERERDDRRDRERRAPNQRSRIAAPVLAGREEDRAQICGPAIITNASGMIFARVTLEPLLRPSFSPEIPLLVSCCL